MTDIFVAVITGVVAIAVCLINNNSQNKKIRAEFDKHQETTNALIEYKLNELTKRVDKHNNVIERTYKLEETVKILDEREQYLDERLGKLNV